MALDQKPSPGARVWWWDITKGKWVKKYGYINRVDGEWAYFKYSHQANDGNVSYRYTDEFRRRWAKLNPVTG